MANFADLYMEHLRRQRKQENLGGKIFLISAAAATLAAGVALLTSPKSGKENRDTIKKFSNKVVKQANNKAHSTGDKFADLTDQAESKFNQLRDELTDRVEVLQRRLKNTTNDVSDATDETINDAKVVAKRASTRAKITTRKVVENVKKTADEVK